MKKTKRLYWDNPYQKEFDAVVVDVVKTDYGDAVVLDQTCFYAMSGGQAGDSGLLNDYRVRDTRYHDDSKTIIYHYMENETKLKAGDKVHGVIDWDRRYKIMRNHTLVHVTDIIFEKEYGKGMDIGSNVNEKKGRVDYEFFDEIDIEKLTKNVQEVLDKDLEIICVPSAESEDKRIWIMKDYADMPCGGTHPKKSSEVGQIKLKRKGLGRQGQRIYCKVVD